MDQSAGTSAAEETRIRDWMANNQASYDVHRFFRDKEPLGWVKEGVSATPSTGEATKIADNVDQGDNASPPRLTRAQTFSTWLHNPEVVTREYLSERTCHDFTITLKHDAKFSSSELDPTGGDVEAQFILPAGSFWTYEGGRPISYAYPKKQVVWEADADDVTYDEDGELCLLSHEPWCPSYLQLHSYKTENGEWMSPELATKATGRQGSGASRACAGTLLHDTLSIHVAVTDGAAQK